MAKLLVSLLALMISQPLLAMEIACATAEESSPFYVINIQTRDGARPRVQAEANLSVLETTSYLSSDDKEFSLASFEQTTRSEFSDRSIEIVWDHGDIAILKLEQISKAIYGGTIEFTHSVKGLSFERGTVLQITCSNGRMSPL